MVNLSYPSSFGNRRTNKKVLTERGWNPFNRILLLDPTVSATILESQLQYEIESGLFPSNILTTSQVTSTTTTNQNIHPNMTSVMEVKGLNFSNGMTHYVSSIIMTQADRQ